MKRHVLLVASIAILFLAGCTKSASVSGESGAKLTLVKPSAVTIQQGGLVKADIEIQRENVEGDVTIRFTNLPNGVDVVEADSKIVGDRGSYTLRAGENADLVENFTADVTASAGPDNVAVTQSIDISVKPRN